MERIFFVSTIIQLYECSTFIWIYLFFFSFSFFLNTIPNRKICKRCGPCGGNPVSRRRFPSSNTIIDNKCLYIQPINKKFSPKFSLIFRFSLFLCLVSIGWKSHLSIVSRTNFKSPFAQSTMQGFSNQRVFRLCMNNS